MVTMRENRMTYLFVIDINELISTPLKLWPKKILGFMRWKSEFIWLKRIIPLHVPEFMNALLIKFDIDTEMSDIGKITTILFVTKSAKKFPWMWFGT